MASNSQAGYNPIHGWHPGPGYQPTQPTQQNPTFQAQGPAWVDFGAQGASQQQQQPQPHHQDIPTLNLGQANNGGLPGIHFHNSHGGIGNEPGYDYLFPRHHTKIHVIWSATAPWLGATQQAMSCYNVATNITIKELMYMLGCTNPARSRLTELNGGGGGRWYRAITYRGNKADDVGKRLEQVGWNHHRDGVKKDFVWVWLEK